MKLTLPSVILKPFLMNINYILTAPNTVITEFITSLLNNKMYEMRVDFTYIKV